MIRFLIAFLAVVLQLGHGPWAVETAQNHPPPRYPDPLQLGHGI
jgi:hypothetical protein